MVDSMSRDPGPQGLGELSPSPLLWASHVFKQMIDVCEVFIQAPTHTSSLMLAFYNQGYNHQR